MGAPWGPLGVLGGPLGTPKLLISTRPQILHTLPALLLKSRLFARGIYQLLSQFLQMPLAKSLLLFCVFAIPLWYLEGSFGQGRCAQHLITNTDREELKKKSSCPAIKMRRHQHRGNHSPACYSGGSRGCLFLQFLHFRTSFLPHTVRGRAKNIDFWKAPVHL